MRNYAVLDFLKIQGALLVKKGEEILLMGKLIVIEGTDGSGKSTQFRLLTERVAAEGYKFQKLIFPQYQEESSALIRMYLSGEFGSKPSDVNAYAASAFYAVDRYASYKKVWPVVRKRRSGSF